MSGVRRDIQSSVDILDHQRDALTAADAHGDKGIAAADPLQFISGLDRQDRAGRTDRMAKRDADPFGFSFSPSNCNALATERACAAKASLASITSI